MTAKLTMTAIVVGFSALTVSALAQQLQDPPPQHPPAANPSVTPDPQPTRNQPNHYWRPLYGVLAGEEYATLPGEELQLARNAEDLVRRLSETHDAAARAELKAELEEVLAQQFDLRQKRHTLEIEALEAEVQRLRALIQKRQEHRADIIANRANQLAREAEGLGWVGPASVSPRHSNRRLGR